MKIRAVVLAVLAALIGVIGVTAPAAHAHAPYCGIRWGSLPKAAESSEAALLTNVRAGRHSCFDRIVLDYADDADGFRVRYVSAIEGIGLPRPVDLRGGALLEIVVQTPYGEDSPSFFSGYNPPNRRELVNVSGWRTFRQVSLVEVWESQVTLGLGVRARLPFRVFTLDGPCQGSRIIIDVAHRW
jgi:hypothetical protein